MNAQDVGVVKDPKDKYVQVAVEQLTAPSTGQFMVYANYYWSVTDAGNLLFYSPTRRKTLSSPQCNYDRTIAEKLNASNHYPWPTEVKQLPLVFVPLSMSDY